MNYFIGLDIGSSTVKAAVAQIEKDNSLSLVSLLKMPSFGIKKGAVDNFTDATQSVGSVLTEIKQLSRSAIKNVVLGVGTVDTKVQYSRGVVAVSRADDEIFQDDIARAKQSSQAINLSPNRMILHIINKEFVVDGIGGIKDPLGMIGKRLEVNTLIVDAFSPNLKNLKKIVDTLGGEVQEMVLSSLASSVSVLSRRQMELGVALIDIGAGKTCVSVFEDGELIHAAVIPVGSNNITNDLAIGLKIPIETAEKIKLSYGSAISKELSVRDIVELEKIDPRTKGTVSKKFIAEIIEDRLAEIFELVNNEIKIVGKEAQLPAGVVLVGGGAKVANITELARRELELSAQLGIPDISKLSATTPELGMQAEDPEFSCVIGLLLYENAPTKVAKPFKPKVPVNLKKIFNYFIP